MTALTSLGDAFLLLGGPIGSSLAVISSTVYLRRFLHFQSSPSYRVAASVPEGFRSLPYPVVPKERQLIINVRLENIQRVAICASICVQTLLALIHAVALVGWSGSRGFPAVQLQLACGALRGIALTVAWGHFLYQRRSSRPVTQLDTTLWLYRLSLRGTMHLEFWLVNLGMALAEVTAVALCCGNIFHLPLISVCTLGSTIVWATLIAGITIQQFHFHRYYGIPIIGIGLATALTQIPAWAARCIFWCFPDLCIMGPSCCTKSTLIISQPSGLAWTNLARLLREIELDKYTSRTLNLAYWKLAGPPELPCRDLTETNPDISPHEPSFFFDEINIYSTIVSSMLFNREVYIGTALLFFLGLIREGLAHLQSQAHLQFQASVVTQTTTIVGYWCYYYFPSQVISEILPAVFHWIIAHCDRLMRNHWSQNVYSRILELNRELSCPLAYPMYYLTWYVDLVKHFHTSLLQLMGCLTGVSFLLISVGQTTGFEIVFLALIYLSLNCFINYAHYLAYVLNTPWSVASVFHPANVLSRLGYSRSHKLLNSEQFEYQQLIQHLPKHWQVEEASAAFPQVFYSTLLSRALYFLWVAFCIKKLHAGSISHTECLFIIHAYDLIAEKISKLANFLIVEFKTTTRHKDLIEKIYQTGDTPDDDSAQTIPFHLADGDTIEFRNVSFAYDVRTPVLKDLNFSIPVGRTTAIVGISGHGKSTILNLIMRMMDVSSGAILIGGVDIRRMAQRELRSQMALVNQFFTGFPGSIYFNIAYGAICQNKLVSRADVISAARSVGLCDKIMALPHGFDSPFDAQGGAMSGGELQRMGLARALVKQAPILLLDEATAALDSISETKIMEHIRRSGKTRTTVILAHRLSTIRDADQIIVLDHGRVAETGTHLELVARGGIYSKMWNMAQQAQASDSSVIAAPVGDIA